MRDDFYSELEKTIFAISSQGLRKIERLLSSAQNSRVSVNSDEGPQRVVNLCSNNYLGLASDRRIVAAAERGLAERGYGMASVRFICGTMDVHRNLERNIASFLACEDALLYTSCFDANGGLFEPLLGSEDVIISDSLNHASIIDGIRLCKARRHVYANADMVALKDRLQEARSGGARHVMIATDGVFSMDGSLAPLPEICALAQEFDALVMVDDSHAVGVVGRQGKGTPSHFGVKVDILSGTLGKALGGAVGGYVAARGAVIEMLRQRSRPYLFSNSLPPATVYAALEALNLVTAGDELRARLHENAEYWRRGLTRLGFDLLAGEHPIVPIMVGDAELSQRMSTALFSKGVYVTGFFHPVVAMGKARIRTQMSAAHTQDELDFALNAFELARQEILA